MIARNGLCLKNIWTETEALGQSPRCVISRTPSHQMFQVHTVALRLLASACFSVSFLVCLAPKDAQVPGDKRTPVGFPLVQAAGHLGWKETWT